VDIAPSPLLPTDATLKFVDYNVENIDRKASRKPGHAGGELRDGIKDDLWSIFGLPGEWIIF